MKLVNRSDFSRANFIEPKLRSKNIESSEQDTPRSTLMLFARMNPPTKKHIDILRQMMHMAQES